jgi:hypothetical protein
MPVTAEQTTTTTKERGAHATRRFYEALGLGVVAAKNLPYLTIALTEATTEEIAYNSRLRERITALYRDMVPPPKVRVTAATTPAKSKSTTARSDAGARFEPGSPPDLHALAQHYPPSQWRTVLGKFTKESLKKAIAVVQDQHPGTVGPSTSTKAPKEPMVTFLLQFVPRV